MFNMPLFAERLNDLIFDNKTTAVQTAKALGVPKSTIYRYLNAERIPNIDMLIKLADLLHCSISFLIGIDNDNYLINPNQCPVFSERLKFLISNFKITKYKLTKDTDIPESIIYSWQSGKSQPSIESVLKLAEYFNCSVDYIVGREN